MVRIIGYKKRKTEDDKTFYALHVQGGIEMVKSQVTGSFYATARKTSVISTFDEETCKALIGTEMPGKVEKVSCEAYEYTIKETGEVITLTHRYTYLPSEDQEVSNSNDPLKTFENSFSSNGSMEFA